MGSPSRRSLVLKRTPQNVVLELGRVRCDWLGARREPRGRGEHRVYVGGRVLLTKKQIGSRVRHFFCAALLILFTEADPEAYPSR